MRLERALNRGLKFGAQLGLVLGLGVLAFTGTPLFAGGFAGMLGMSGLTATAGLVAEAFAGIAIGAAIGGASSVALHAAVQLTPGAAYALGDAPPRYKNREAGVRGTQNHQPAHAPAIYQPDETDDRNMGFRRMLEERDIMQREQDMGR